MRKIGVRNLLRKVDAVSVALIALTVMLYPGLNGCAILKPDKEEQVVKVPETAHLRFRRPLVITTPEHAPVTVEERIRCALFYFEKERFGEAAAEFDRARQGIARPDNPLYRACLMSMATSYLLSDDRAAFVRTVGELRSSYSRYQLIDMERRDPRLRVLMALCKEFVKSGNY